jgi:hypothetical protein
MTYRITQYTSAKLKKLLGLNVSLRMKRQRDGSVYFFDGFSKIPVYGIGANFYNLFLIKTLGKRINDSL